MTTERVDVLLTILTAAANAQTLPAEQELLAAHDAVAELIEAVEDYIVSYLQDSTSPASSTDEAARLIVAYARIGAA